DTERSYFERLRRGAARSVRRRTQAVAVYLFLFQAEDGIRDLIVTGVQTCALPISGAPLRSAAAGWPPSARRASPRVDAGHPRPPTAGACGAYQPPSPPLASAPSPAPSARLPTTAPG